MQTRYLTTVEALRSGITERPEQLAYTFLVDGETDASQLTYREIDRYARAIGAQLQAQSRQGDRALLLYPPGLEFVAAFLGCLYAGVVAVPLYPPSSRKKDSRFLAVVQDAEPNLVLTSSATLAGVQALAAQHPRLSQLPCLATDALDPDLAEAWREPDLAPETLAFLQYTSGSTAAPKGVMVTHGNLVHNEEMICQVCGHDEETVMVSWLPPYHDMGLIAGILQPLFVGGQGVLMSPVAFLQRPVRWLQAISRYRGTTSGGPNFAYDLCVRKISEAERRDLDLRSWRVAFNGAEPVRAKTLERFTRVFAACGFDRRAPYPCYGLAEATLLVTGGERDREPPVEWLDPDALEEHRVAPVTGMRERVLVGCGQTWSGQQVRIVDPDSLRPSPPDRVGEIWVAGPSVAAGYWRKPEETARDFGARIAGEEQAGTFLRTGDLGFLKDGELFVTGRSKDLIIIRGRNLYPQDVELTAGTAHRTLRAGGGAAFAVDSEGEERLVIVHEVEREAQNRADVEAVAAAIRRAVAEEHEVQVYDLVLIATGTLFKTSSGKVRRSACREAYLHGQLAVLGSSRTDAEPLAAVEEVTLGRDELLALAPEERPSRLADYLRSQIARMVGAAPGRVELDQPVTALGLDSLQAIELKSVIEAALETELSLVRLLEGATPADLVVELLTQLESEAGRERLRVTAGEEDETALSRGQRALWFLEQMTPGTAAFLLAGAVRVRGHLDAAALERALTALVARHPILRTTFTAVEGEPRQDVREEMPVAVVTEDASRLSEVELRQRLEDTACRPFDLERGPLFRLEIFQRGDGEQVLLLVIHHLITDLWSIGIFLHDLKALYLAATGAPAAELPAIPIRYADYVRWQEAVLAAERGEELWSYWSRQLGGELAPVELPADRPRSAVRTLLGAMETARLDSDLLAGTEALGQRHKATLFTTLLAGFEALLHRYTGQDDVVVGAPTTGRNAPELTGVMGYFVNPVVLRGRLSGAMSFAAYLERTRQTVLEAFAHQDYPFPLLAERLHPERDASRPPIFQVMFIFQQARQEGLAAAALGDEGAPMELLGLPGETVRLGRRGSQLDLSLFVAPASDGLRMVAEYSAELFDAATLQRLLRHYQVLLESAVAEPDKPLASLPLLLPEERRQILEEWNADALPPFAPGEDAPPVSCLHELVERRAAATPQAVALVWGETALTFGELDRRAGELAARLRALGAGPEVRVGVCLKRTPGLVVALLGVLKAGAAYVPIDPAYPAQRQRFMLEDSEATVLVSEDGLTRTSGKPVATAAQRPAPAGLAYVIYTSGSTGRPKGVAIRHSAAVAMVRWAHRLFAADELSRVLAATSVCFDLSVYEIFVPLAAGGTLILAENALELPRLPARDSVTLVNTVPSAMNELVRQGDVPSSVRTVNLAGEPLKRSLVDAIYQSGTVESVLNLYGPSEDTTYSTWVRVPRQGRVSIGRPVSGTRAYVLDRFLQPIPVGVPGELYLGGEGLARGYLNRPALTAERFVPDLFSAKEDERLYRTGDLVRHLPSGELDFLGRIDHQVKVRGYRIELGEVESVLLSHEAVRECVVVAHEQVRLVAYVVGEAPATGELESYLRTRLPAPMVPAAFVVLDEMPRLPNGKVDRRALPAPDWSGTEYVAPRKPLEELLANIWSEVLGVPQVGIHDNFFALGGHSLLATQVVSRIRHLGAELPVRVLFEAPTIAALAERVEQEKGERDVAPPILPVPRQDDMVLSFAQERMWFLDEWESGKSAFYNIPLVFRLTGRVRRELLEACANEIVRRHEGLRTSFGNREGRPFQIIAPPGEVTLSVPVVDLRGLTFERRRAEGRRVATAEIRRVFNLTRSPLVRVSLIHLGENARGVNEHFMTLCCHHIIFDGWSAQIFLDELVELYEAASTGRPSRLAALPVQYADYAVWQRQWLQGEMLDRQLGYWRHRLEGLTGLELPVDRPRPPVETFRGTHFETSLSEHKTAELHALARREGVSLFMVLLTAFLSLIRRYTGRRDPAIGSPIANRNWAEIERVMGFFANTLVLRTEIDGEPTFRQILGQVKETCLEAYAHQDLPFEKLVDELQPARDMSRNALFQVMLVLENQPGSKRDLSDFSMRMVQMDPGTAKFDMILFWWEEEKGRLDGLLEYATDIFDYCTVRRHLNHYLTLLDAMVEDMQQQPQLLPVLSPVERHQFLHEWNDTRADDRGRRLVHRWAEEQAARTPDAVAVVDGEGRPGGSEWGYRHLSYQALNERTNQLAARLTRLGVGPERLVGICVERSIETVVGFLAVLKAGGAGVALDPAYPKDRLAYIIRDADLTVLLTQADLLPQLPAHGGINLLLDGSWRDFAGESTANPEVAVDLAHPIYAIYTSGTTGLPKGILVTHRTFSNLVDWQLSSLTRRHDARTLQFAPFGFCVSFQEIFTTWCSGGTLVIADDVVRRDIDGLAAFLEANGIERLHLPFAALKQLAEVTASRQAAEGDVLSLRLEEVGTSGEQLQASPAVRALFRRLPECSFNNQYGASETHVVTAHVLPGAPDAWRELPPAGRPLSNVRVYVLDEHLRTVPIGVAGILFSAGASDARGYLRQPVATAVKFLPDPFSEVPGSRLYRTGDLARLLADGEIGYLGRGDDQVKIRGFRVELGEVETVLARHERVRDVAILARDTRTVGVRLVAYVVPEDSDGNGTLTADLRDYLKSTLPEYMIPPHFVYLESLPLNTNSKLDREALPAPQEISIGTGDNFVAPRDAMEEAIAQIWSAVLETPQVGVHDSFFEIGGHSLLATQIISRVRSTFQVELSLRAFFEEPTVEGLARRIIACEASPGRSQKIAQMLRKIKTMPKEELKKGYEEWKRVGGTV